MPCPWSTNSLMPNQFGDRCLFADPLTKATYWIIAYAKYDLPGYCYWTAAAAEVACAFIRSTNIISLPPRNFPTASAKSQRIHWGGRDRTTLEYLYRRWIIHKAAGRTLCPQNHVKRCIQFTGNCICEAHGDTFVSACFTCKCHRNLRKHLAG